VDELEARLNNLARLFSWQEHATATGALAKILELSTLQGMLVDAAPASGMLSIPRLIVLAATSGQPLRKMREELSSLDVYGVHGPRLEDTYLGLSWEELSAASEARS
jgi:hypothetical protein